ncbi:semaphorin-4D-like [Perognathus longimembris pacificus]|uniref:semaphorin-4D-like n=1 Tax=Perognathus longimembris pacificus TaxID=214514 RepID=UPI002019FC53|nr:semaphorin-4D-like [Perognathus longimembris pacificus]
MGSACVPGLKPPSPACALWDPILWSNTMMCGPIRGLLLALVVGFGMVVAFAPIPRITWELGDLMQFHEPSIFNYSELLLNEYKNLLYVGAREAVFALNMLNISQKKQEVQWKASDERKANCIEKGRSKETECLNYIRVLQQLTSDVLYVCGTNAFQPTCDYLNIISFKFLWMKQDGRGKCPFNPAHTYTSVMVDGELYAGTTYNFLGSEFIISRNYFHSHLRTESDIPWLYEPNFIHADVIRKTPSGIKGDENKVYFFFTEVSVEYDFFFQLKIPRIARVCMDDQGGKKILQNKWTSFLKAKLLCCHPDLGLFFNVLQDAFILRPPAVKEPVFYVVFTSQLNSVCLSAVCTYTLSTVEAVFSHGNYMQKAHVDFYPKWLTYHGEVPTPRPGMCINSETRAANYNSSLHLPDKTLLFIRDHPLIAESVTPIGNKPILVKKDVNYTQIVVDRTQALDKNFYDVMFIGTAHGTLHKAVQLQNGMHIIEETRLFQNSEPVQNLLLSSKKGSKFAYASCNSEVVQVPLAFCRKHSSCEECVLARDPYCAWSPSEGACVALPEAQDCTSRYWTCIQDMSGDVSSCPRIYWYQKTTYTKNCTAYLKCPPKSNIAQVVWKFQNNVLNITGYKYSFASKKNLIIFNLSERDSGVYSCLSVEKIGNTTVSHVLKRYILEVNHDPKPD